MSVSVAWWPCHTDVVQKRECYLMHSDSTLDFKMLENIEEVRFVFSEDCNNFVIDY